MNKTITKTKIHFIMKSKIIALAILTSFSIGCGNSNQGEHEHSSGGAAAISHTIWTDKTELFVEFLPLVVGKQSSFAAHFSEMEHFKAIGEGSVTVRLSKNGKGISNTVDAPSSPGIFRPSIKPETAGSFTLVFEINTPGFSDTIAIDDVEVYADEASAIAANSEEQEDKNIISFLKEQAWKIDFATAPARRDTIYEIITAGGEIMPSQGDEIIVTALTSGIVIFNTAKTNIGNEVNAGELLFTIGGGGISDDNIEAKFQKAKSSYEQAKANYDRKSQLYDAKAISKTEFEEAKLSYELAQTEYNNLAAGYGKDGKRVSAPTGGFIKNIYKTAGEYATAGEPLATIAKNKKLTLKADVAQKHFGKLKEISTANFITTNDNRAYSINQFNGKLLSYGKNVSEESPLIPVYFEIDNQGELLPGSFIEVFIKAKPLANALVIPSSALLEDYGNYSVYVQTEGESFEKREVEIGISDGLSIQLLSGVTEGEHVVTVGIYQIKMASMSDQMPAHGHVH